VSRSERSPEYEAAVQALKAIPTLADRAYAEATTDRALATWAEREGLRQAGGSQCAGWLHGKTSGLYSQEPGSDCRPGRCCPPGVDHPSLWLKNGKPAKFVYQPYQISGEGLAHLADWSRKYGMTVTISTWPAWHFPSGVLMVEVEPAKAKADREERSTTKRSPFHQWLMTQTSRDDAVGDLARGASQDYEWPRHSTDLSAYRQRLREEGAVEAALDVLDRAWEEWRSAPKSAP
jgi:uncharacterized protein YozE (UPF0346 family)